MAEWTEIFIDYIVAHLAFLFDVISLSLKSMMIGLAEGLIAIPPELLALALALLAWRIVSWKMALFTIIGLLFLGSLDLWKPTMETLALVIVATLLAAIIGVPLGIWGARNHKAEAFLRPVLDFMQTMPSFVYLIPALILFGIGQVPALIATLIFCSPPVVRLSILGIRSVPAEVVEAGKAFGSTPWQLLWKIQLPIALPTIMAGINQTIMLALSMVVIAAMIGAGGLGGVVYFAISKVKVGVGLEGGLGIVVLAIILDRLTSRLVRRTDQSRPPV